MIVIEVWNKDIFPLDLSSNNGCYHKIDARKRCKFSKFQVNDHFGISFL